MSRIPQEVSRRRWTESPRVRPGSRGPGRVPAPDELRASIAQQVAVVQHLSQKRTQAGRHGSDDGGASSDSTPVGVEGSAVPGSPHLYSRLVKEEEEARRRLQALVTLHPTWHWLSRVEGISPLLIGPLLGRLDATKANTPSAFWAFCGLGTTRNDDGRVAQASRHQEVSKGICRRIGISLFQAKSSYAVEYDAEFSRLAGNPRDYPEHRRHLMALRKMEKLFLAHLWVVWREALALSVTQPQRPASGDCKGPWEMISRSA